MTGDPTRRTVLKGTVATGAAATGVTAFGGQAAGQQEQVFELSDVEVDNVTDQNGLVNVDLDVVLQNVNVDIIDNIVVNVRDVRVIRDISIDDVEIIDGVEVLTLEDITIEDINVQALNNLNVVVQALSDGNVVQTARQRVDASQ